ncbi:tetratricopeptide repeat-containing sensor histidine kinase [Taibaiella koreensis]|uniref:tetratricopeptide repeat-containing sensor histidine kinase n=1 Tax=Taibaiella koreensis TaxID=1268548 RepID=UPI0013C31BD3|nr:ATP-binding protein [Taibaiella koreensis]
MSDQIDSAASYYHRALTAVDEFGLQKTELPYSIFIELSNVYSNNEQPHTALFYLNKAKPYISDEIDLIPLYENFSTNYVMAGDFQKAKAYADRGLLLLAKYKLSVYEMVRSTLHFRLGQAEALHNLWKSAIAHHLQAAAEDDRQPVPGQLPEIYVSLARVYYLSGDAHKASATIAKLLRSAQRNEIDHHTLNAAYNLMCRLYTGPLQDYRMAYHYKALASRLADSLHLTSRQKLINELEVKYRTSEKDKEISRKQAFLIKKDIAIAKEQLSSSRQRSWILTITLAAFLLICLIIIILMKHQAASRIHKKSVEMMKRENEVNVLRSRIAGEEKERQRLAKDLHDGVVVLFSSIKMRVEKWRKDPLSSADLSWVTHRMEDAIRELKISSNNLMPHRLHENGLVKAIEDFCLILRQGTALDIVFQRTEVFPRLNVELELFIYRIIQELLQNIMKHAEATKVLLQMSCRNHLLSVTVEDNGKGFDLSATRAQGSGLNNIWERLAALGGQWDINSNAQGTTIHIEIEMTRPYG